MRMPTFAFPWALLLLAALPLTLWWWRRGRATLRFSDLRPVQTLPLGRARAAQTGGVLLRLLALAALIIAAASPRWPDRSTRIETEGIAIAMVLDVSGSMAERDFLWEGQPVGRLEGVKKVFRRFVEGDSERLGRPSDLIMLVVFAARPETACPLTFEHDPLLRILDEQQPRT